jgi:hypothetical protein
MKARRTEHTDKVLSLPGGTEDNDLWFYFVDTEPPSDIQVICSVWVPTDEERKAIAAGANIRLGIWSSEHPPVTMDLTKEKIGRASSGRQQAD